MVLGRVRTALVAAVIGAALLASASTTAAETPPRAAQNVQYEVPLAYLTPIPVVRLAGGLTRTGARVTLLSVRAPQNSTVTLRCSGGRKKGCPFRSKVKRSPRSRVVRFREIERRLRAGVRLKIFVSRGNTIGKYTSFLIRRRRFPSRSDFCVFPGDRFEPRECP